ncbi:MAG: sigma-70 family RNA polymerase sigma factor [Actinomycetota bacterium]
MDSGRPSPRRHGPGVRSERSDLPQALEQELAERARVDIEAFAELYRHYLPRIHSFAYRRTGNRQAAEDICAATFEAALNGIGSFTWRRGGFGAWLYRIAANQVIDHHRREARPGTDRGQQAMAAMHTPVEPDVPEAALDALGGDRDELRQALHQLNPRYQRALSLRYLADLDHGEAADAMGLTRPAFAVVLSRAVRALRRSLDALAQGGDSTDG